MHVLTDQLSARSVKIKIPLLESTTQKTNVNWDGHDRILFSCRLQIHKQDAFVIHIFVVAGQQKVGATKGQLSI